MAFTNATNATVVDCTAFEEEGGESLFGIPRWVIGVVFGLLGSIAINTGNNIQSLGLMHLEEDAIRLKKERDDHRVRREDWLPHGNAATDVTSFPNPL